MRTITRLSRYLRHLWRTIVVGLVGMALFALFSGFSVGLILPIVDKVFMRTDPPAAETISVAEGLGDAWTQAWTAFREADGFRDGLRAAKDVGVQGILRVQDQAPPLQILAWLCVISLVAILLKNAADFMRKMAFIRVEQRAAEAMRRDLFARIITFPLGTFNRIPSGQILSRLVADVELVKQFTINTAAAFVHNLLQVLMYLAISVWASYQLALVSFVIVPPIAFITAKLASRLRRHSGLAQARIAEVTTSLSEILGGIRIVKAFGTEEREGRRFSDAIGRYRQSVIRLLTLDSMAAPLSEFWGVTVGVCVLYFGGRLVLSPEATMTPGRFFVFFLALVSMLHPLKELANVVTRFQRGAAAADRLFEILDLPGEEDDPDAQPVEEIRRDLGFENVSFAYDPGRPVLQDISFTTGAGTTTALVGPSGGGKSTLVDLIPRFYDPDRGRVLLDGRDVRGLRRRDLRALMGAVTQETLLFDDTVFNNIAYGIENPDPDRVREAARIANADEFIDNMEQGYDTMIGERGVLLSGGQRQRLAIARAVLRNPPILILDEATSSLDSESETLVQEALERLLTGRTTFVIAHRLSTVRRADQILVVSGGRIVQRGTHDELVNEPGVYRRLYDLQFQESTLPSPDAAEAGP